MSGMTTVGLDLARNVFQLHGADASGRAVLRRKLRRGRGLEFLSGLPLRTVAMEACGGAHHWGREIGKLGHEVRLIPPAYVKVSSRRSATASPGRVSVGRGRLHEMVAERLGGGAPSEAFARGRVQAVLDGPDGPIRDRQHVGVPWQMTPEPAVGVLDRGLLPGRLGITEPRLAPRPTSSSRQETNSSPRSKVIERRAWAGRQG